jgi:hypothetical protein
MISGGKIDVPRRSMFPVMVCPKGPAAVIASKGIASHLH